MIEGHDHSWTVRTLPKCQVTAGLSETWVVCLIFFPLHTDLPSEAVADFLQVDTNSAFRRDGDIDETEPVENTPGSTKLETPQSQVSDLCTPSIPQKTPFALSQTLRGKTDQICDFRMQLSEETQINLSRLARTDS